MTKETINELRNHMHAVWQAIQLELDTNSDLSTDQEILLFKLRNALSVADNAARNLGEEL